MHSERFGVALVCCRLGAHRRAMRRFECSKRGESNSVVIGLELCSGEGASVAELVVSEFGLQCALGED